MDPTKIHTKIELHLPGESSGLVKNKTKVTARQSKCAFLKVNRSSTQLKRGRSAKKTFLYDE